MATEFNSGIRRDDSEPRKAFRQSRHWSTYVILALLAVVIAAGMLLTLRDEQSGAAGTTVGSTAQAPPPAPVNRP